MDDIEHHVAIDVSCSCGKSLSGAWSADEARGWIEYHGEQNVLER